MREIKFRTWYPKGKQMQTTTKKWGGDVFIRLNGDKVICIDTGEWEEGYQVGFCKDNLNLVLMQYTGLKDIKGKEIYEGDIVKCADDTGIVNWQGANFQVNWCPVSAHSTYLFLCSSNCEIIGNIYENKELLK